jgi:hypothetical protein
MKKIIFALLAFVSFGFADYVKTSYGYINTGMPLTSDTLYGCYTQSYISEPSLAGCTGSVRSSTSFEPYFYNGVKIFLLNTESYDCTGAGFWTSCSFRSQAELDSQISPTIPVGYVCADGITCKKITCPTGFHLSGSTCASNCGINETYTNGACQCITTMTRDSGGVCSSCGSGQTLYPNSVCYGSCPSPLVASSDFTTKAQLCRSQDNAAVSFFPRINPDGTLDAIDGVDGSFIRYSKAGLPIAAFDSHGNPVSIPTSKSEFYGANPRGSVFNPIIGSGLVGSGYLITAAGILASSTIAPAIGSGVIVAGGFMFGIGSIVSVSSISNTPISSDSGTATINEQGGYVYDGGSSASGGGGFTLNIQSFDTSGASGSSSTTTSFTTMSGAVTQVTKLPNADTVSDTKYPDGSREVIVASSSGDIKNSVNIPAGALDTPKKVDLIPETAKPVVVNTVTKPSGSVVATDSNTGSQYQYDQGSRGYIPTGNPTNPVTGAPVTGGGASSGSGGVSGAAGSGDSGTAGTFDKAIDLVGIDADSFKGYLDEYKTFGTNVVTSFISAGSTFADAKYMLENGYLTQQPSFSLPSGGCSMSISTSFGSTDLCPPLEKFFITTAPVFQIAVIIGFFILAIKIFILGLVV